MKKILIIAPLLILFTSCRKDLSKLNVDTKHAILAPSYTLFSNGQRNLIDYMTSANVNRNIFRLITQQWTEITYVDETNFDLGTRAIPDNWWRAMYKLVLVNLEAARKLIPTDVSNETTQKNELAMLDVMEVYTYYVLVNTFGDVAYTEALDPDNLFPKYDGANTIYYDLLDRLDADITALDPSGESFGDADLLYGGDVEKWTKFANSLKLRMGITIADFDAAKAKSLIEAAAANAFTSNADNAVFHYFITTPNTNPIWVDLVQSGRNDFVATSTIVNKMLALKDPRISAFFGLVQDSGKFIGAAPGKTGTFKLWSPPSDEIELPDAPSTIMSYAEIEFILAEAVERGYNVGGTAESHYNNAVTASILQWGGTTTDATAYLAQPSVAYATAAGTFKEKIGIQKYLALYNDGFDAWTEQRRLDYPVLPTPFQPQSAYPVRFTYPANEQNLNSSSWNAAKAAMGGNDQVDSKLFWDMN